MAQSPALPGQSPSPPAPPSPTVPTGTPGSPIGSHSPPVLQPPQSSRPLSWPHCPSPHNPVPPASLAPQPCSHLDSGPHCLVPPLAPPQPAPGPALAHRFFRCWMLPRHRRRPFTMMANRVHNASHSSMLRDTHRLASEGVLRGGGTGGWGRPHLCDVSTTERPVLMRSRMRFQRKRRALGSMPVVGSSWRWAAGSAAARPTHPGLNAAPAGAHQEVKGQAAAPHPTQGLPGR